MIVANFCHAHRHGRGPHEPIELVDVSGPMHPQRIPSRDRSEMYVVQICRHCGSVYMTVEPYNEEKLHD
jgi:hypothetical protein